MSSGTPSSHQTFDSLAEAFLHHKGRLLLLGRPGAGKTTTLWMFARERADACLADPSLPIPIFLKIDTWNRKTPIADWVRSQMPGLPLQNSPLLYLCDGLDELGGERLEDPDKPKGPRFDPRGEFLRLAEEQLMESPFVISCRVAEYEQIRSKMHRCGAVTLLPLGEEKIEEFLKSWNRPRLWKAIQNDQGLMDLARTPLLLALLCFAVGEDESDTDLGLHNLTEASLFSFYFDRRFAHEEQKFKEKIPLQKATFEKATTRKLLGNLALYMWSWVHDPLTTISRIEAIFKLGEGGEAFLAFAVRMHFLRKNQDQSIAFIHLKFRDFCALSYLQETLNDPNTKLRQAALKVMGRFGLEALPYLRQALKDPNVMIRQTAIEALKGSGVLALPYLQQALIDSSKHVRRTAVTVIGALRVQGTENRLEIPQEVFPPLFQALRDRDGSIRQAAMKVFTSFEWIAQGALPYLQEALKDPKETIRQDAIKALCGLGVEAIPYLQEAFKDPSENVRQVAVIVLGGLGVTPGRYRWTIPKEVFPALLQALKERDKTVRQSAVRVLRWYKLSCNIFSAFSVEFPKEALSYLQEALKNPNWRTRRTAVMVLEGFGSEAFSDLQETMQDRSGLVRLKTAQVLGTKRASIPLLLQLLQADRKYIRWGAVYALYSHGYVPVLHTRFPLQISLHNDLTSRGSFLTEILLGMQVLTSLFHWIPLELPTLTDE